MDRKAFNRRCEQIKAACDLADKLYDERVARILLDMESKGELVVHETYDDAGLSIEEYVNLICLVMEKLDIDGR